MIRKSKRSRLRDDRARDASWTDSAILRRQTHYPCSLLLGSRIVLCTVISIHGVEARVGKVSSSYVNHFRLQNKHTAADICMIANCLQRCRCCLIHICDPLWESINFSRFMSIETALRNMYSSMDLDAVATAPLRESNRIRKCSHSRLFFILLIVHIFSMLYDLLITMLCST